MITMRLERSSGGPFRNTNDGFGVIGLLVLLVNIAMKSRINWCLSLHNQLTIQFLVNWLQPRMLNCVNG